MSQVISDILQKQSAALVVEQKQLKNEINSNNKACLGMQKTIQSLISASVAKASGQNNQSVIEVPVDSATDTSDNDPTITEDNLHNLSLDSLNSIQTTDDDIKSNPVSESYNHAPPCSTFIAPPCSTPILPTDEEETPEVKMLLSLMSEGKVVLSEKVRQQLDNLNTQIKCLTEATSNLQDRWSALDSAIKELKKLANDLQQYIKSDNLLFHNFKLPNRQLSSLEFSNYMVQQINYLLPQLLIPVSLHNISDAHPLRTKSKNSNVIIVRFCNRNIKHEIYSKRAFLSEGLSITEHLTQENLSVLFRANKLFGSQNVCTENCKILVRTASGKQVKVQSIKDVNEAFESFKAPPRGATTSTPHRARYNQRHTFNSHARHQNPRANHAPNSRSFARVVQNWNNSNTTDHNYNYTTNNHFPQSNHREQYYQAPRYGGYRSRNPPYSVYNR